MKKTIIIVVLALALVGGIWWIFDQHDEIVQQQGEIARLEDEKATLNEDYEALEDEINNPEHGYLRQINDLSEDVRELNAQLSEVVVVKNPTSAEWLHWLYYVDKTDELTHVPIEFESYDFALILKENARNAGFRCGIQVVYMQDLVFYATVVETTDRGIMYFSAQTDGEITLILGLGLWDQNDGVVQPFDDTIIRLPDPDWN
jgi:hypothetical protein